MKKQKGITLIALIITIIVMLILVGVTVNVALNGGLFNAAEDAAKKTQVEIDKEILQSAVIAALNEELKISNADSLKNNLPERWEVTGSDGGPYTATSPSGNEFTVDGNGKITSDSGGQEVIAADWWKLTDTEMQTLKDNNKYSEEEDLYTIADITIGEGSANVMIENMMGNTTIQIFFINQPQGDFYYTSYLYVGDETVANSISLDANKWYYLSNGSDLSTATEYTGAFPLKGQDLTTGVYCESYVNRIKASFKDNGSSNEGTEETVENWWEQTATESTIISKKSGLVAEKSTVLNYNIQANEHAVVIMQSEKSMYFFILKDEDANTYSQISGKTIEKYKWYYTSEMTTLSDVSLCTGQCPVAKADFDQMYCESYLNRVIENFNK